MATFYVANFGCRATQADGAAIERQFQERGLKRAGEPAQAEIVVLNTCTVTAAADQDARAAVRRIHRKNPNARIVVTGCYAQRAPEEIAALPGVSSVIGNSHKHRLAGIALGNVGASVPARVVPGDDAGCNTATAFVPLSKLTPTAQRPTTIVQRPIFVSDIFAHTDLQAAPVFEASNERTRPNLKVQDGCDNRCSFCVIPYVRGQSRSLRLAEIVREVESRAILGETALQKLRISSVEPMDWSDDLIDLVATSPRIAKHAHVPLQSGSDAVLRRMHRKYRPWHYREKIEKIRAATPTAAIGADVMAGFPGETENEFEETRRLIEDLPFTYLHVFTYSARPGTPAAAMAGQVPIRIAHERNRVLRDLASQKKLAFMHTFVGKPMEAITLNIEGSDHEGKYTQALTDNYLRVRLKGSHSPNRWIQAWVEQVEDGMLVGVAA